MAKVRIWCYYEWETRNSAKEAMDFYLQCMMSSDGCERDRYTEIYLQLENGATICTDGCYHSDEEQESVEREIFLKRMRKIARRRRRIGK